MSSSSEQKTAGPGLGDIVVYTGDGSISIFEGWRHRQTELVVVFVYGDDGWVNVADPLQMSTVHVSDIRVVRRASYEQVTA